MTIEYKVLSIDELLRDQVTQDLAKHATEQCTKLLYTSTQLCENTGQVAAIYACITMLILELTILNCARENPTIDEAEAVVQAFLEGCFEHWATTRRLALKDNDFARDANQSPRQE